MPRRQLALLLTLLLCLGLVAATPAAADEEFADDCYDGPAADASALNPHMWAPAEPANPWAVHRDAQNVRAGWIGFADSDEEAEPDEAVQAFTANIQVTAMPYYPVNAMYRFAYTGPLGEHFVIAQATETTEWRFRYGHLDTSGDIPSQVTDGETTGAVDEEAGVITMDLPEEAVPPPSEDGSQVTMPLIGMSSHTVIGTAATGGVIMLVDSEAWVCTAVLYEAEAADA